MRPLERISYRNLHYRVVSCGIFVILLFTIIAKTKDSVNVFKLHNHAYMDDVVSNLDKSCGDDSASGNGLMLSCENYYFPVFQRLVQESYLKSTSKSLCIHSTKHQEAVALKRVGISDVVEFSPGQDFLHSFGNHTFDFEFLGPITDSMDVLSVQPLETASELCRTLRYGGYLVIHIAIQDDYSFHSFIYSFAPCRLFKSKDIRRLNSSHSIREAVLGKNSEDYSVSSYNVLETCKNKETVPEYKWDLIRSLEPISEKEPAEDWTEWEKYSEAIKLFKYLPTMVDLRFKKRFIYIDLGARTYDSTIGSWFEKLYPKQNKKFEIYAIEADKAFHKEYKTKKGVTLLPYAAWIKNETLVFGTRNKKKEYTGKIQRDQSAMQKYKGEQNIVQAFDFADWLIRTFSKQDFVVLKMDVEGSEMDLIPRLVETGAICLIDELFVECHYDRWVKCCSGKRTQRYHSTYAQCFDLFSNLRKGGSIVHQWW